MGEDVIQLDAVCVEHDAGEDSLEVDAFVQGGAEGPFLGDQSLQNPLRQLRVKGASDVHQVSQVGFADLKKRLRVVAHGGDHDVADIVD